MLPVATVEDLVIMKLEANRPLDIEDVMAIKDVFAANLDLAYLRAEANALGLGERIELYFGKQPHHTRNAGR